MNKPKTNLRHTVLYSQKMAPYVFVLPFILSFLIFFLYPTISTVVMSFQEVLGLHQNKFIGFKNYSRLLDVHFYSAITTNTLYAVCTIAVLIPVPMLLAVVLNSEKMPFRNVFRSMFFLPALTSVIVAGVAFRLLFGDSEFAFVNSLLMKLGVPPVKWMLSYWPGMFIMVFLASWRWAGVNMVYFLSGLQNIPVELYEAADIDGANVFQKFFKITLPMLKPIAIYVLTISIYGGYAMFGESYVYWNENMPGDIGMTIVRYIYQQAFQRNDMGFGSAIGISLLAIVLTINLLQLKFFGLFRKED
ncbi:MAG: sugar ABC transporter permease [Treponemataceae bacterium]